VVCTAGEGGALGADGEYLQTSEHMPLRAAGLAVFTVDQRGAPGHGAQFHARAEMGGADIDDVIAAGRYLATLPAIDANRVSILGTSRGAYSALLALERSPALWHRAALLMGFYDPAVLVAAHQSAPGRLLPVGPAVSRRDVEDYFAAAHRQPLPELASVSTPMLVVHGDADPVIPPAQAEELAARAKKLSLPARLLTVPGLGHDSEHASPAWADIWPEIGDFLTAGRES
jgi:phthiocerol/phenolphthiocerol synthesis type-I polyketide synthase C